mmetsp:Transcript_50861/g.108633  ORF Transcript_50861/g.108633 Transcript_50861/m.108633 type:complete len:112 (-) Transcript_50861:1007-1342(-)
MPRYQKRRLTSPPLKPYLPRPQAQKTATPVLHFESRRCRSLISMNSACNSNGSCHVPCHAFAPLSPAGTIGFQSSVRGIDGMDGMGGGMDGNMEGNMDGGILCIESAWGPL